MATLYFPPALQGNGPITKKFRQFHAANPHTYDELKDLAIQLQVRGYKRYGMKGLFEVLRLQTAMKTRGSTFKLNNNYTALYARLLMHNEPRLQGFFSLRESRTQVIE